MANRIKKEVKDDLNKAAKAATSKVSANKTNIKKKATASKKNVSKKEIIKKKTSSKKPSKTVTKSKSKTKAKTKITKKATAKAATKPIYTEYYDLPYGYNETTVKILAQTPTTLFVYWEISEEDRNKLLEKYGKNFFYETKPIMIIHNITKNYSHEIEINDFANSWYIRCQEPNCDYTIELGRKLVNKPEEYVYIDSSNDIVSPNDHILFEKTDLGNIKFRNIKTGRISTKDFGSLRFINNIDKIYGNIYDIYSALYRNELNELTNPSSGEFIMR